MWDIQQKKDKLWVEILSHKYCRTDNFIYNESKSGSPIWVSINKAKELLKHGYHFRLGAGDLSFWFDTWADISPLHQLLPYIDIHDMDLKLNQVYDNQVRNWNLLYTSILNQLKAHLQSTTLYLNPNVKDLYIWKGNANGTYSTKSGFQWLLNQRSSTPTDHSWSWLWKFPAPENMNFFFWLAFHISVPIMSIFHHRNIAPTTSYCRCQGEVETLLHCMRDCPSVRRIWALLTTFSSSKLMCTFGLNKGLLGRETNFF